MLSESFDDLPTIKNYKNFDSTNLLEKNYDILVCPIKTRQKSSQIIVNVSN